MKKQIKDTAKLSLLYRFKKNWCKRYKVQNSLTKKPSQKATTMNFKR